MVVLAVGLDKFCTQQIEVHKAQIEVYKAYVELHKAYVESHKRSGTPFRGTQDARKLPEPTGGKSAQGTKTV